MILDCLEFLVMELREGGGGKACAIYQGVGEILGFSSSFMNNEHHFKAS